MNRYYYSCPIFEKFENIKENIKSKNIIFLGIPKFLDSGRKCRTLESGLSAVDTFVDRGTQFLLLLDRITENSLGAIL